ncbi:UbiA prenyltransferase [Ammonifex degensii KC4]|uniref:UbiA prenyltransferase n=2 Tax=Ammonifex degensii TaxID=42838 RepID=C9RD64_AMMDK|nr:UbiA prenyltransferase [Ammonifex degensii KC4]
MGGSIYFWGGVVYAIVLSQKLPIADIIVAWFCLELMVNQAKYWLNDYRDVATDRLHPRKKERVSAAEYFPVRWLPIFSTARMLIGAGLLFGYQPRALIFALLLPTIQLLYDSVKRIPLINAGVAACGSMVRFAAGYAAVAGGWPLLFPCLLVYLQRLAIYVAAYTAEGRYLLKCRTTAGKEYTVFYARHPCLEKVVTILFLGVLTLALGRFIPGGIAVAGVIVLLSGVLYYRLNGPGDRIYWRDWRAVWRSLRSGENG